MSSEASTASKSSPRVQARAARTREKIERAALTTFSEMSYEAASTREIAKRAGVNQQLITYHYGSKLDLWKTTVERIGPKVLSHMRRRVAGLEGVDGATRARLVLREFILFNAENLKILRFMMIQGSDYGARVDWLYENYSRHVFALLREQIAWAQEKGLAPEGDSDQLTGMFMGSVSIIAGGAEFERIKQRRAFGSEALDQYIDLVLRTILPGCQPGAAN